MDFKEIGSESVYWIRWSQDRAINDGSVVTRRGSAPPTKHRGSQ